MYLFDLTGKKAVVTGAASGLGLAMAEGLHEAGAAIGIVDIAESTAVVAAEMGNSGAPVFGVRADLSKPDDLERGFREIVALLGGLDILVNNVGITRRSPTEEHSLEDWESVVSLNMTAMFLMSKSAARIMLEQGSGKVINIGSLYSFTGGPNQIGYTASKGAVRLMTMAMSNEWAGRGINVNAIAPTVFRTDLTQWMFDDKEFYKVFLRRIPIGRLGEPEDFIGTVLYLSSRASAFMTGAIMYVDGGYTAG